MQRTTSFSAVVHWLLFPYTCPRFGSLAVPFLWSFKSEVARIHVLTLDVAPVIVAVNDAMIISKHFVITVVIMTMMASATWSMIDTNIDMRTMTIGPGIGDTLVRVVKEGEDINTRVITQDGVTILEDVEEGIAAKNGRRNEGGMGTGDGDDGASSSPVAVAAAVVPVAVLVIVSLVVAVVRLVVTLNTSHQLVQILEIGTKAVKAIAATLCVRVEAGAVMVMILEMSLGLHPTGTGEVLGSTIVVVVMM